MPLRLVKYNHIIGEKIAAYIIAEVEVLDPVMFEQYRAAVPATIAAYGGRYVVRGGAEIAEALMR